MKPIFVARPIFFALLLLSACADPADPPQQESFRLVELHGIDGDTISVNPSEVVSIRTPRKKHRVLAPGVYCAVMMTDGKFISVVETCVEVARRLEGR